MNIPKYIIPVLVILTLFGGFYLRTAFTQPTTTATFGEGEGTKLECVVEGVKCKGTARFFTMLYEDVPGISGIETYASDRQVVFTYDTSVITPDSIRAIMEAPVLLNDGSSVQVFRCLSMEQE